MEDPGILTTVITLVLGFIPGAFLAMWQWFKAQAAVSENKWDDRIVDALEQAFRAVAEETQSQVSVKKQPK